MTKLLSFIYTNIDWDNLPKQQETIRVITMFSANEEGKIDQDYVKLGIEPNIEQIGNISKNQIIK
ncbi:MAG: hypothetical protein FWH18_05000 [Marinilabiliaceae bacterium]|nr:hypothetical protein [Marinilabiliaceae bacterium]